MTESAGSAPAEPDESSEGGVHVEDNDAGPVEDGSAGLVEDSSAGPAEPAGPRPRRTRHWLRWTALGTSVVVLAVAGTGWWFYRKLDGNITTDNAAAAELRTYEKDRPTPVALDAQNILLIGSDSRSGKDNGKYGRDDGGSSRSDTTMLMHLAADRKSATAISIPRDLMVDIPSCREADGTRSGAQFAQFNWAFEFGGAACTVRTIEKLTGIRVDHHMVIDFSGFKDVVDAVDGVQVCLKDPVDDPQAHLKLPAGTQTLDGEQALGYVRARHGIGDSSDTQRMERQQRFLGALFKKVRSNGVLLNPAQLYPVLDAATKSLTTDPGLGTLGDLYDLASSMRSVPTEKVQFLTAPRQPYSQDPNRDELVQPDADRLFERLRDDEPVTVEPADKNDGTEDGTEDSPDDGTIASDQGAEPDPTFSGTNAAVGVCE
ncbi:LCP family protein [Streptomyces sp. NPDC088400]|uniref:LCP family protein n=1 Tax=Streptomyces sp. NPDC088400 TaxID=3365861 RepID=UPI00382738A9